MLAVQCVLHVAIAGYINNYPLVDNAYGVKIPPSDVRNSSFAFLIADYGLATAAMTGECCQTEVADLMRKKRSELEAVGKSLLFVGAAGDNFYFQGVKTAEEGGETQWKRWDTVYNGLNDVPWFAAMGNHDFGDADVYATCPEKAPRVNISGQAYASNQLDASKGGYRPSFGNVANYHLPDFNYRVTLDALNLEIFGIDQNYVDVGGIGGGGDGCKKVKATCGGDDTGLGERLQDIGHSGEALLAQYAAKGAKDPKQTRNVLVLQHYPGLCAGLKAKFTGSMPPGETVDFRCSFGHTHNTVCESGTDTDCEFSMNGGGGGCCEGDVTNNQAGFGILYFEPAGGMRLELVHLGHKCQFSPSTMTDEERAIAKLHMHGDEHISSFAAAKLEINAGIDAVGSLDMISVEEIDA
jgi:hypothetical protein